MLALRLSLLHSLSIKQDKIFTLSPQLLRFPKESHKIEATSSTTNCILPKAQQEFLSLRHLSPGPALPCRHPHVTLGQDLGMTASAPCHPSSSLNCRPSPQQEATSQWAVLCQPAPSLYSIIHHFSSCPFSFFFFLFPCTCVLSLQTQESSKLRTRKQQPKKSQSFTTKLLESSISVHCLYFLTISYSLISCYMAFAPT